MFPRREVRANFVELAEKNARMVLSQDKEKIKREELRTIGAMNQVGEWIGLVGVKESRPMISPISAASESVGSMIVYEDGRPKRNDYRKFRIKPLRALMIMHPYGSADPPFLPWTYGGGAAEGGRNRCGMEALQDFRI